MKPIFDDSILQELKRFCDQTESTDNIIKGKFHGYYLFHYTPSEISFLYRKDNKLWTWTCFNCHSIEEYKSNFYLLKNQYLEIKEKELKKKLEQIDKDFI